MRWSGPTRSTRLSMASGGEQLALQNDNIRLGGWGWPMRATKPHWYEPGEMTSVCGRWMYSGQRNPWPKAYTHNACVVCRRKLEKRQA